MTNALPPAHWAADPSGRHEHRYWDGTRWTDHVADQGRSGVDPIINEPAATSPEPAAASTQTPAATPQTAATPPASTAGAAPTDATAAPEPAPSIAWRPEAHATHDTPASADAPAATEAGSLTWPPEPGDTEPGEPSSTQAGWAAPTPVVPVAPVPSPVAPVAPSPVPSSVAPPPPPPVAGTGFVTAGRLPVYGASAWRSIGGLKTALVVLFIGMGLSSFGLFATFLNRISVIDDFQSGRFVSAQSLRDADDAVSGAASFYTLFRVAIIVVFIIWMWRASKNALDVLGRDRPKFTPGWSIGGWFIPFANFVIPVMIIQGLWRASAPGTAPGTTWREAKGSALVAFWWVAFLASTVASFTFDENDNLSDVKAADTVGAVGAAASVAAAVLAILLVVQLTRRFEGRRVEELGA